MEKKNVFIETDVVEAEIPMLLSKNSMKKGNAKLDFVNDTIDICGETTKLNFTSSGHYMIDILPSDKKMINTEVALFNIENATDNEKERMAKKLHTQFGHANSDRLLDLVKDAGVVDTEFRETIRSIEKKCEICKRYKKHKPRPVVGFSLAKDFNDVVSVDLKDIVDTKVFHMIDHATRYSAAVFIKNKSKEVIVDKFFMHWISLFGCPKKLLSDNGREFNNALFREMAELLSVELLSTAAESPWSNGITERHNALIGQIVIKVIKETSCSKKVALAYALSAKNALKMVHGFSSNQLVFSRNPNFPSLLDSNLPGLNDRTSSEVISEHLNALHAARKAFIENEASDKLRRALQRQTRTSTTLIFDCGDKVYYKRRNNDCWHGPGVVIGKDSNQAFVKHGGEYFRVSPVHMQHVNASQEKCSEQEKENQQCISDVNTEVVEEMCVNERVDNETDSDIDDSDFQVYDEVNQNEENIEIERNYESENDHNEIDAGENVSPDLNPTLTDGTMPKNGSKIKYKLRDSNEWKIATVLGRAGTARGKNKWWINIKSADDTLGSLNMEQLNTWEYLDQEVLVTLHKESEEVLQAKLAELDNLKRHNVYVEIDDLDKPKVGTTWIISENWKKGHKETKARLVARGYQEKGNCDIRRDSPTCLKSSLRLVFCVAASNKWIVNILDIRSAFLQGKQIQREIFIKPPREIKTNKIWKLNKTIYGLNDASRQWYLKVKESLEKLGVCMSIYDEALFFCTREGKLQGIIALHVDDFFHCGTVSFQNTTIKAIKCEFEISKEADRNFSYIGLEIEQTDNALILHQKEYIDKLECIALDTSINKNEILSTEKFIQLRSLIGQLAWVSGQTRPDIAFDVCQLSVNLNRATINDVLKANKCVKKLKRDDIELRFPDLGDIKNVKLLTHADASFNNLGNGASQGAYITFICGENNSYAPLSWQSKKLQRVVKSTLGAETMALLPAVESCFLFSAMLKEILGMDTNVPIICKTDSQSLKDAAYSSKTLEDSRLKIDIAVLRDYIRKGELQRIDWVATSDQLADSLTKSGASTMKLMNALKGTCMIDC